jgi:large subunit ribosomal protein L25
VLYGKNRESTPVAFDPKGLLSAFGSPWGRNTLLHVRFAETDAPKLVYVREAQINPVKRTLIHADLWEITTEQQLEVVVPVRTVGRSEGEKGGAKLFLKHKSVKVSCKPMDIPSVIEIDVSPLQNGQGVSVEAVPLPAGVKAVYRRPYNVVFVGDERTEAAPAAEGAAPAAAAAAAPAAKAPAAKAPAKKK